MNGQPSVTASPSLEKNACWYSDSWYASQAASSSSRCMWAECPVIGWGGWVNACCKVSLSCSEWLSMLVLLLFDTARRPAATHRPPIEPTLPLTSVSYLAIPPTSVASERVFSLSGCVMRNRLLPETATCLVFLNKNLDVAEWLLTTAFAVRLWD